MTLASFNGSNGAGPEGGIVMDASGNIFGPARNGGAGNDGGIFELTKGSRNIVMLASFNGANGANPTADLLMDAAGNLFGTTLGTSSQWGTAFELAKGSHAVKVLGRFGGAARPFGGLAMDKQGNLFGTTGSLDEANPGTIFEITKAGALITLAQFKNYNGRSPEAAPIIDASGNLFGTVSDGGMRGYGGIYELPVGSSEIQLITSFDGTPNGAYPASTLITDGRGRVYGTTYAGGTGGLGTAFGFTLPAPMAPTAAKVVITKQPTKAVAGTTSSQPLVVAVKDATGKIETGVHFRVTLELASGPKGGVFAPVTVDAVNGVATFNVVAPAVAGAYTFRATVWGLPAAVSSNIAVTKTQPAAKATR